MGLVCLYEFMGQIFFMYAVLVSGGSGSDYAGIVGPLALFAIASIFGGVSGGHFNPAVTIGVYFREAKYAENFIFLIMIVASQICGALVGMFFSYLVLRVQKDGDYTVLPQNVPLLLPSTLTKDVIDSGNVDLYWNFTTWYMEVVCTFVFVLTILHVTGKRTIAAIPESTVWILPTICIVLWALCNVCYFTGASFNPALAIGSTVFQYWWYPNNPSNVMTHYLLYYVTGAAVGGMSAGLFYQWHKTLFPDPDEAESKSTTPITDHQIYQVNKSRD